MSDQQHHHRRLSRAAIALVSLCVGSQFVVALDAATLHVVCAVHGELVHATDGEREPIVLSASSDEARLNVISASPHEGDLHEHDHCMLAFARRGVLAETAGHGTEIVKTDVTASAALESQPPWYLTALVVAPKASPPHA